MFYSLKTLFAVLLAAGGGLWLIRKLIPLAVMDEPTFKTLRNAWLMVTVALFLGRSLPLLFAFTAWVAWRAQKTVRAPVVFFALMLAVPQFEFLVEGLGPIQNLIAAHHMRVLSWVLFIPMWLQLRKLKTTTAFGRHATDWFVLGAGLLQLGLQMPLDSFTNILRTGVMYLSDVVLPYYVMSRAHSKQEDLKQTMAALVFGVGILGLIALVEWGRAWLLYNELDTQYGVYMKTPYLIRGDTGWLRAFVSAGHSLAFGYAGAIAILMTLAFKPNTATTPLDTDAGRETTRKAWLQGLSVVAIGLFCSLARGSWLGAAAGAMVWAVWRKGGFKQVAMLLGVAAASIGLAATLPGGEKLLSVLPLIGTTDSFNVEYRQRLLEVSWMVLQENLWLGSFNYYNDPAMLSLVQGDGIIDMVNTYLGQAMTYGLVGLFLFVGAFLWSLVPLATAVLSRGTVQPQAAEMGRVLMACLVATMIIIGTTSPVLSTPWIFYCVIGLAVACRKILLSPAPAATGVAA